MDFLHKGTTMAGRSVAFQPGHIEKGERLYLRWIASLSKSAIHHHMPEELAEKREDRRAWAWCEMLTRLETHRRSEITYGEGACQNFCCFAEISSAFK